MGIFRKNLTFCFIYVFIFNSIFCQNEKLNFDNFSVENGLNHNFIQKVYQDKKGWIWIGTSLGVERFDGYNFKSYLLKINDTSYLGGMVVRTIFESTKGILYIGFEEMGLGVYDREKDEFKRLTINGNTIIPDISVKDIVEDKDGNLWIATKEGLYYINLVTGEEKVYKHDPLNANSLSDNYVRKLAIDSGGKIWVGSNGGLDLFDPANQIFIHFTGKSNLLNDYIYEIYIDTENQIWVGTSDNGIITIQPDNFSIKKFPLDEGNDRSRTVRSIIQDRNKNFWIGTRGGLYLYDIRENRKVLIQNEAFENNSLIHNSILDIMEDIKGDIWIGTRGGLSYLVKEKQVFKHFKAIPGNNHYMNNGEVYCFWVDPGSNKIWIGTENGGINILDRKNGTFEYIIRQDGNKKGLSSNCVKAIMPDGDGNILIGTFQGGLNVYNTKTREITWLLHNPEKKKSISGNIVWSIVKDHKGNIWVGTNKGLDKYDAKTQTFEHIPELVSDKGVSWIFVDSDNDLWLRYDEIRVFRYEQGIISKFKEFGRNLIEDSKGRFWLTTDGKGIALYDKYNGALKYYNEDSGLISNHTLCILEDNNKTLWVSTANGLSRFIPEDGTFRNFDKLDGLQGDQFNYGAGYKLESGDLLFGGNNGFNIFRPENIAENTFIPPVYISDFRIYNQPVGISNDKKSILKKSILESNSIEIPYKYNVLSFEFCALNYANSSKNKYKYKLEGFDSDWTETTSQRNVTYTNLDPGEYILRVYGANNNEHWNPDETQLAIKIKPPYYSTWWFISVLIMFSALLFFLLFMFFVKRKNLRNALVFEKEKAQKLQELDLFKLRFFTNISHELKTPLTLIISPLEKMLKVDMSMNEMKENLKMIHRNANQLLNLVIQLLDYRKLEAGKLKLELKKGDIVKFIEDILYSFDTILNEKSIKYNFKSVQNEIVTFFDADKIEKIINNLISNAIKYTNNGGSISVFISIVIDEKADFSTFGGRYIKIVVKDNGVGIHEKDKDKIFNRFYSATENENNGGSGIGLAFSKELVELHRGKIYFESNVGKGTSFTIMLPYLDEINTQSDAASQKYAKSHRGGISDDPDADIHNNKVMLIVEDNTDVRNFIKSHFNNEYEVLEAVNGKEGLELATKTIPDIIISDIMMPLLNGDILCEKIKKDERTSHIPIILLSVLTSKEKVMESLIKGADDYITKPFDITILQAKVENLLSIRKSLREKYSSEMVLKPSNIKITSPDERFLQKAIQIIEKNMDNPNLDIDNFVSQIGISRMQLYRKMSALTNMTVKEFINDIRLKRAVQLIMETKLNISEIAYSVGFSDISYFGKCFRKKFGMSASKYSKQKI